MASLNIQFPNEERIFQLFDTNDDNHVDCRELIMGLALLRQNAPANGSFLYVRARRQHSPTTNLPFVKFLLAP
eukprot:1148299-Prorocentrum_minimum.AAC.2